MKQNKLKCNFCGSEIPEKSDYICPKSKWMKKKMYMCESCISNQHANNPMVAQEWIQKTFEVKPD